MRVSGLPHGSRCHNSLLANDISIAKMTLPMPIVLAVHTQPDMYLQVAPIIVPHPCLPRQFSCSRQTCNHMDLTYVHEWSFDSYLVVKLWTGAISSFC